MLFTYIPDGQSPGLNVINNNSISSLLRRTHCHDRIFAQNREKPMLRFSQTQIKQLQSGHDDIFKSLQRNLYFLGDLAFVYDRCTTTQKQQLIREGSIAPFIIAMGVIEPYD